MDVRRTLQVCRCGTMFVCACTIAVALLSGCDRSNADVEPTTAVEPQAIAPETPTSAFESDVAAQQLVRRAQAEYARRGYCSNATMEQLVAASRKYPNAAPLIALLDRIFSENNDGEELLALHAQRDLSHADPADLLRIAQFMNQMQYFYDAEAILKPLHKADPKNPKVRVQLAVSLSGQDRHDEVASLLDADFEKCLEAAPFATNLYRGMAHFRADEFEAARTCLTAAHELMPDAHDPAYLLARTCMALDDTEAAKRYFAVADAARDRKRASVRWQADIHRLSVAWDNRNLDECLARLDSLYAGADSDIARSAIWYMRGNVHRAAGRADESGAAFDKAQAMRERVNENGDGAINMTTATRQLLRNAEGLLQ